MYSYKRFAPNPRRNNYFRDTVQYVDAIIILGHLVSVWKMHTLVIVA